MKTRLITMLVLVVLLAIPVALYAQDTDPAAVAKALANALNAGDVEAALALFADDAVVDTGSPASPYTGKEAIRAWLEGMVATNFQIEIEILQVEGDIVTERDRFSDDDLRNLGIAPLEGISKITVQDGKVTSLIFAFTDESLAKLQAAMAPESMPQTGGAGFPGYVWFTALAGLAILTGLGVRLVNRRSSQLP
ncbi:MAG: nuclear transport factor 2 family protein [Anaerolineae bacterium]